MLVQCPGCQTTYRVSEEAVATSKPTFRCSRCKNVFDLGAKGASKPARERGEAAPAATESQELSFSFPADEPRAEPESNNEEKISELAASAAEENGPSLVKEALPASENRDAEWNLFGERPSEADFDPPREKITPRFQHSDAPLVFPRERPSNGEESVERAAPAERPLSVAPFLLLCAVILVASGILTLLHKARPDVVEQLLKAIPLIGTSVSRNDYLRQGIVLQTNLTRFQRIQGNREVFLLSGAAVNRNRVKIREVKVQGVIYGRDGSVIESQVITIGNAISPKIIRDLTQQEILDLQKTSPVKRFEIQPDEAAPFSIVFFKATATAQSFGYRVLSAEES